MECLVRGQSTIHNTLGPIIRRQTSYVLHVRYNSILSNCTATRRVRTHVRTQSRRSLASREKAMSTWNIRKTKEQFNSLLKSRGKIVLTSKESEIIQFLNLTAEYLNRERLIEGPQDSPVQLYMVGGWVRDKLLDRVTMDMDIIVRNIQPKEFVQRMIDLCGFVQNSPRLTDGPAKEYKLDPVLFKRKRKSEFSRKVQCRTYTFEYKSQERSISVAGCTLFDYFVNLEFTNMTFKVPSTSHETYAVLNPEQSELLELRMDALQRELTINALYVDLNTMNILDPTLKGIEDMANKVLKTPLLPKTTLMNDPTRVLRIMRWSSTLQEEGFRVDGDTFETLSDPSKALTDIPPDKMVKELSVLLSPKNNPARSLRLLNRHKYYTSLFVPVAPPNAPPGYSPPAVPLNNRDFVSAAWFINHLCTENWDLWVPFEESLLGLRAAGLRTLARNSHRELEMLRRNTQAIGYSIAVVMPWRKYPEKPIDGYKTFAGSVLSRFTKRIVHVDNCRMIDKMFDEDEKTAKAIEVLLRDGDAEEKRMEMENMYGYFWSAHVLCSAIFEWCEKTNHISEWWLEERFEESRERWNMVSTTVDILRWSRKDTIQLSAAR